MRHRLAPLAALALALVAPAAAPAQRAARPYVAQTLSTNPLALPFGVASAEYERALGRGGVALGVGGLAVFTTGYGSPLSSGERYETLQAKLKYYPREDGLRGFAVGVTAGVAHARSVAFSSASYDENGYQTSYAAVFRERTAPTLGATLDYNVFLGRRRNFLVGLGVGAKRALGRTQSGDALGATLADGRLQVGFGF